MIEIYKAIGSRKTYIVCEGSSMIDAFHKADKHYKTRKDYIRVREAWKLNDELYFENPHKKGQKRVWAAYVDRERKKYL